MRPRAVVAVGVAVRPLSCDLVRRTTGGRCGSLSSRLLEPRCSRSWALLAGLVLSAGTARAHQLACYGARFDTGDSRGFVDLSGQPARLSPGFPEEEGIENYLQRRACGAALSRARAQRRVARHWLASSRNLRGGSRVGAAADRVSRGSSASGRFGGYVAGAGSGAGHRFVVGDGLYLVFRDARAARTRYRVCWGPQGKRFTRCWQRTTGARGAASKIFTPAPNYVGNWTTRWYVGSVRVASWTFFNDYGD
jgi:hypothetical protein